MLGRSMEGADEAGKRLTTLRLAQGIGLSELARRLGVTPQQVFKYEQGITRMSVPILARICKVLGCSADYIVLGDCPPVSATTLSRLALARDLNKLSAEQQRAIYAAVARIVEQSPGAKRGTRP